MHVPMGETMIGRTFADLEDETIFAQKIEGQDIGFLQSLLTFAESIGSDKCRIMIRFEINRQNRNKLELVK